MDLRLRWSAAFAAVFPALASGLLGACFNFDATTAGGALTLEDASAGDSLPPVLDDAGFDAPAHDAKGPPVSDDANVVPPDVSAPDSNVPIDATPPPFDAGHSFCAAYVHPSSKLFFCDDFDERPLPGLWNSFGETNGMLSYTQTDPYSAPNSLDETVQAAPVNTTVDVALRTQLQAPSFPSTLRFAFAIEPLQIDPTQNAAIVLGAIDFLDAAGQRYTMGIAINVAGGAPALALGEQSAFSDGGAPFTNHQLPPNQPLPMNAWTNLVLQVNWTAATTAEAIITVNGLTELDVPLTITVVPTTVQIGVGTSYVFEPSPVWELRYDNVVFTAQ